ncbi:hypothetical protein H7H73_20440 [Mycobacterium rufum]|uniref:Uncharacterized protein n=1 Tax=Mycolicibacterium rufum TaxID=318424 RepID=A0A9X3BSJ6_9MYCO|nr:hypothetical protein [Mycolicibacterium rufum]
MPLRAGVRRQVYRDTDERSMARIAGAAVVAVGLVLSGSLYHLPGDRTGVVLGEEDHGSLSTIPDRLGGVAVNQLIDFATAELPTLAHLAEILQKNFPAVRAEIFLSAVEKHGLPQIVRTLEVLASAGFAMPVSAVLFGAGGGGGGGGSGSTGSPIGLSDLELLWQYLIQHLPPALIQGVNDVVAAFIPASVSAAQVQQAVQVLSIAAPPAPPAPVATTVIPASVVTAPPPVATPTPPPAPPPPPPTPVIVAAPPAVEVSPPTVDFSTPAPPPMTPEVTPEAPAPEDVIAGDAVGDDIGNTGAGGDSGPAEGSSDIGDSNDSASHDEGDSRGDTVSGGDTGSTAGQGAGDAAGPDNGPSGGGESGGTGSDGG